MRLVSIPLGEFGDERTLANTGLTPEQDDLPPGRIDIGQQISHQAEFSIPLQKHEPQRNEPAHIGTYALAGIV